MSPSLLAHKRLGTVSPLPQGYSLENLICFVEFEKHTKTAIQIMSNKSQSQETG